MKKEVINSPIRWAGSKKKILNEMLTFFDTESEYYIEPFLGSGVVLINLMNNIEEFSFKNIIVNDINTNIINFYQLLKDNCKYLESNINKIIKEYNNLLNIEKKEIFYYDIRKKYNETKNKNKKSIYFYFLMKAGYNGVYRENKRGNFNVPFGKKEKLNFDITNIRNLSNKLANVEFYNYDYIEFLEKMKKRKILEYAFVYCDPPYIPEEKIINKKQELYTNKSFEHTEFIEYVKNNKVNKILISMSESKKADSIYGVLNKYKINEIVRTINPKKTIRSTEVVYANYKINKEMK